MDNSKFFKIVIIVLLGINMATLAFMWSTNSRHGGPPRGSEVGDFLSDELSFTKEQQSKFELLKRDHQHKVKDLRDKNKEFHDVFYDILSENAVDSLVLNNTADSIIFLQKQIEMVTFYHFQDVRAICNLEQQKKFDEVIKLALQMMSPRQKGPPPGPPH